MGPHDGLPLELLILTSALKVDASILTCKRFQDKRIEPAADGRFRVRPKYLEGGQNPKLQKRTSADRHQNIFLIRSNVTRWQDRPPLINWCYAIWPEDIWPKDIGPDDIRPINIRLNDFWPTVLWTTAPWPTVLWTEII